MASSLKVAKYDDNSSPVVSRYAEQLRKMSDEHGDYDITFAHASMCQVYLPYQDHEPDLYEVTQGDLTMRIQGALYMDQETKQKMSRGVPSGTRARLLLYLINEMAIMRQEPSFQLAKNFSDLCRKLRIPRTGRSMAEVKKQLERLCTASFSLEWKGEKSYGIHNFFIVESMVTNGKYKDMDYAEVRDKTRGFHITLSDKYFDSVIKRGVPLDKRTITALQNNSMCLDIYNWLTHRLCRIPKDSTPFVTWEAMRQQFGHGFSDMYNFKRDFRKNLKNVTIQYKEARITEVHNKGFQLHRSAPPIGQKMLF